MDGGGKSADMVLNTYKDGVFSKWCQLSSTYMLATNTFKGLVGCSPTGTLTFISELYAGSVSDKELTRLCGILNLVEPGDAVMADKGFDTSYDNIMLVRDVELNIPPFAKGTQMSSKTVVKTRQIASCRIHVERCISRIKQYHIVGSDIPFPLYH